MHKRIKTCLFSSSRWWSKMSQEWLYRGSHFWLMGPQIYKWYPVLSSGSCLDLNIEHGWHSHATGHLFIKHAEGMQKNLLKFHVSILKKNTCMERKGKYQKCAIAHDKYRHSSIISCNNLYRNTSKIHKEFNKND